MASSLRMRVELLRQQASLQRYGWAVQGRGIERGHGHNLKHQGWDSRSGNTASVAECASDVHWLVHFSVQCSHAVTFRCAIPSPSNALCNPFAYAS